jgi:hypothetical protein
MFADFHFRSVQAHPDGASPAGNFRWIGLHDDLRKTLRSTVRRKAKLLAPPVKLAWMHIGRPRNMGQNRTRAKARANSASFSASSQIRRRSEPAKTVTCPTTDPSHQC